MKLSIAKHSSKPTALGMHIYAGGFTLGVRDFFDVKTHFEEWTFGTKTVQRNLGINPRIGSMRDWRPEDYVGKIDFMFCNPPCASWSQAGSKKGMTGRDARWRTSELTGCTRRCFNVFGIIKPKVFAWESVCQAWSQGREFVFERIAECNAAGYDVSIILVNANGCSNPQVRKRFFFVAHKIEFKPEQHTHWGTTVREAMKGMPTANDINRSGKTKSTLSRILDEHPELRNKKMPLRGVYDKYKKEGEKGRPPFVRMRCAWDEPCGTVMKDNLWHPDESRVITANEMKRLCGYPDDYVFVEEKKHECFAQMTKAVMPPVARYLAKHVRSAVDNNTSLDTIKQRKVTIYDFRKRDHPKVEELNRELYNAVGEILGGESKQGSVDTSGGRDLRSGERRLVLRVQRIPERLAGLKGGLVIRRKV